MLDKCRLPMMDFCTSRCDCSCPIGFADLAWLISVIEWQHHVHNDITTGGPMDLISYEADAAADSSKTNAGHFLFLLLSLLTIISSSDFRYTDPKLVRDCF